MIVIEQHDVQNRIVCCGIIQYDSIFKFHSEMAARQSARFWLVYGCALLCVCVCVFVCLCVCIALTKVDLYRMCVRACACVEHAMCERYTPNMLRYDALLLQASAAEKDAARS